ncbi:hypothetical protein HanPI659440_Chr05g0217581 [Helianthus annuus]|nr:hypothetical protein HanPI659440_Chr05g0217581 [Helianthus annuus]
MAAPPRPRVVALAEIRPPQVQGFILATQENQIVLQFPGPPSPVNQVVIQMPSVSPPSREPRYRAIFKERSSYLFVGWATTLLTIGYLWSHDDLEVYGGILMISNMLVALSFLAWLWLSYTYEKANENPTASTSIRFLLLCCYGTAIEAVSMTYMAEYFLARHPIYSASSLCLLIVGGMCYLEAHYMLNPSVIT